jgi:quercetin dioxygenase-like cupin family protein
MTISTQLSPPIGVTDAVELEPNAFEAVRRASSQALHPSVVDVEPAVLCAIASGLAAVTLPWEVRTGEVPEGRRFARLLSTPVYEAWVICWPAGTELDLHDHGGSAGAFTVVAGQLDETTVNDGRVVGQRYQPGETAAFGPAHVHAVANRGQRLATSVHVYSPPLEMMDYYDRSEDGDLVAVLRDPGGWVDAP